MGKVVILGGNARSGKSTLAHMLSKSNYTVISFDILQSVIEESFNLSFDKMDEEMRFNFFQNIVNKYIKESEINDLNVVLDMYDYLPKDIDRLENKDKVEVYFLAYPNQTKEEIKYNIIHYSAPTDWIAQVDEDYLNSCVDRFYDRNAMLVVECEKYNQTLVDTKSKEERPRVLEKLYNKITNN
jgi:adenylate kinase family enzyme